ncbi:MAG TPA: hypothetical protein VKY74_22125 [Chloroflexia bacterium]|nr:hypothetical protein [Chloroflexia bacterium]
MSTDTHSAVDPTLAAVWAQLTPAHQEIVLQLARALALEDAELGDWPELVGSELLDLSADVLGRDWHSPEDEAAWRDL